MSRIAAVVLAAGMASRYRAADPSVATKLVARLDGIPLIRHAVDAAVASRAAPVIVVTGHAAAEVRDALAGLPVSWAENPDYATGLASSLKAGLAAVPPDCDGALVLLGDMPGVTTSLLDRLIAAFAAAENVDAVAPLRRGRRGNPALLGRSLFAAATALTGDEGARRLLGRARVQDVDVDHDGVLVDVDEPASLESFSGRVR